MRIFTIFTVLLMIISMPVKALDVSPDGPQFVTLSEDAASVFVGNPAHASVAMDNPRLLVINAGIPGMTRLTVLGQKGNVILDEDIVVSGTSKGRIRIKNACINAGRTACEPTKMYHCIEGQACHSIQVQSNGTTGRARR